MDVTKWKTQLLKGAAELAVLSLLAGRDRFGLEILESISAAGGLGISEGSIYPLLNRLQREGKIVSRWVELPEASHPRKYYRLTGDGTTLLQKMKTEWKDFSTSLNRLLDQEDR